ncbi:MAG: hypothetical protein ACRD3W_13970, partial [Terriglobales bacterium]
MNKNHDRAGNSDVRISFVGLLLTIVVLGVWMMFQAHTINKQTAKITNPDVSPPAKNATPTEAALHLNEQGVQAMKYMNVTVGIKKLEEAHKADSQNTMIAGNLANAYAFLATAASAQGNQSGAITLFEKSIPLLE